ncbi:uncharacterized protein LOC122672524 [Telopea speciosissima]|uniref:uncharacterized protein LOC122672524 n=1 Tax=Telopea speciosissima TaxID=54955 RepID=UPI001CC3E19E|nr:uncharacterized protein LOC122672524 [Telopea speciosissima]
MCLYRIYWSLEVLMEKQQMIELFADTHQHLLEDSVKWIKDAATASMLVSTLIATMNFTAAFAIPGDYNQNSRLPIFTGKAKDLPTLYAYSTTALFFCVGTLGTSLSAYLSRFPVKDFYFFLPLKYLVSGSSLFCSAIYTVTTFVQALILATNAEFTIVQGFLVLLPTIIAIISCNFIYVDVMFPVFRYIVDLLFY